MKILLNNFYNLDCFQHYKKSKFQIGGERYIVFLERRKEECKNEKVKRIGERKMGKIHRAFCENLTHFQKKN